MPTKPALVDGISAAVIGAADPDRTAGWLADLGFTRQRRVRVPAAAAAVLYGTDAETEILEVAPEIAGRGTVRIVAADPTLPAAGAEAYARGPYAFLVYTRDIRDSLARAEAAGATPSGVAAYQAGAKSMQEARAVYPDGGIVVFVEVEDRRPSLLDDHADLQHSEVHSITFCVDDLDAVLPAWESAGLGSLLDITIANPDVTRFLSLPREEAPIRLAMLARPDQAPARVELLTYPEDAGPAAPSTNGPVRVGLRAALAWVDDLDTVEVPEGASLSEIATTGLDDAPRCARLDLGGGTVVELWERP